MSLEFREFAETDLPEQRKTFLLSFPETTGLESSSFLHYQWKFRKFPALRPAYEYVAVDNGKVIGYYAAIPFRYWVGGRPCIAGMVCDVMTHPDARGKGLFTKLGAYSTDSLKKESLDFATGYPIRPEVIPGHIKVGWKKILQLPMYIRLLRVNSFLPEAVRPLAGVFNFALNLFNSFTRCSSLGHEVRQFDMGYIEAEYQTLEPFFKKWGSENDEAFVLDRSLDFLKWRFSAPGTAYTCIAVWSKKRAEITAYAVVRKASLKGKDVMCVMDLLALRTETRSVRILFEQIRKRALCEKLDAIVTMTSSAVATRYSFLCNLMFKTPVAFTLIVKSLSQSFEDAFLSEERRWHLFWIDSDDL